MGHADRVQGCARCGGAHELVGFRRFSRPDPRYTHFGLCPATGEPILVRVVEVDPTGAERRQLTADEVDAMCKARG